jgi:hypothetical protein
MKSRLRVASSVGRPERQGGTCILAGNVEFPTPFAMVVQNVPVIAGTAGDAP